MLALERGFCSLCGSCCLIVCGWYKGCIGAAQGWEMLPSVPVLLDLASCSPSVAAGGAGLAGDFQHSPCVAAELRLQQHHDLVPSLPSDTAGAAAASCVAVVPVGVWGWGLLQQEWLICRT